MCRLSAITSSEFISPFEAVLALETMKEGHDGSGLGLMLKDLGGPFEEFKGYPVLSAICSHSGLGMLDEYMKLHGFSEKFVWSPIIKAVTGIERRDHYIAKVYDYPASYKDRPWKEKEDLLMNTRLAIRKIGEPDGSIFVFSFYPDVLTLKEVGDPLAVGEFFGLDKSDISAKIVLAQGRQNTNYAINLYACHPFFIEGISTMTNGENTAFVPIRDYLMGQGVPGYEGYNSDSEVFTHILHYTIRRLGLPFEAYKHIITPLKDHEMKNHANKDFLSKLKQICRRLIIDGPNCVIGCLPDKSMFMVQDSKKLRPGVVGGRPGLYAFSSEICGLAIPDRDKSKDFQPMHLDSAIVGPDRQEVRVCRQSQPLPLHN